MKTLEISGLVPATFTPMTTDGAVDVSKISMYAEFLKQRNIKHVFVNGSTGESLSLTNQERKEIAEAWMKAKPNNLDTVIIHVACSNFPDTVELAKHAESINADAIAAMPPTFLKPSSIDALVEFCKLVADGAPSLPFMYYHIPAFTGVELDMVSFCEQAMQQIPNFCGIKFSTTDLTEATILLNMSHHGNQLKLMYGCDQQFLCAMALGCDSAVGSTYSLFPHLYQSMIQAWNDGDLAEARKQQNKIQKVVKAIFNLVPSMPGRSGISVMKAMMNLVGFDVGPVRCPLQTLNKTQQEKLQEVLNDIGYFNW